MADAERFTALYEQHYLRVLGFVMRRAPADAAREAVDEAFLIAWRRLPDVPDPALPWLLGVARNVVLQQYRAAGRADALTDELARLRPAAGVDVSDAVIERITVLTAVAGLSDPDREALMLTVWDGLSTRDAAVVADCSATAFAVRLHRARRRLRQALARIDHHESAAPTTTVQEVR